MMTLIHSACNNETSSSKAWFTFLCMIVIILIGPTLVVDSIESPYLKEILMGRCYEQSLLQTQSLSSSSSLMSNIDASHCDALVGGFMNVLESHSQQDITSTDFDKYIESADFSSPHDSALLWLPSPSVISSSSSNTNTIMGLHTGDNDDNDVEGGLLHQIPNGLVTPHTTFGGRLVNGLVFCASGPTTPDGCNQDESNAYWQFWTAAYSKFATDVTGRLRIVIESPYVDVQFLQQNALAYLDVDQITSIEIWTPSSLPLLTATETVTSSSGKKNTICSSKAVLDTIDYLVNTRNFSKDIVSCHEDLYELSLCYNKDDDEPCILYKLGKAVRGQNVTEPPTNRPPSQHHSSWHDDSDYYHPGDGIHPSTKTHRSPFWRVFVCIVVVGMVYVVSTRMIHRHHLRFWNGTGYNAVDSYGKTIDRDIGGNNNNQYGTNLADPSTQQSVIQDGGSSNGAESFFLNDIEGRQHDAASRLVQ